MKTYSLTTSKFTYSQPIAHVLGNPLVENPLFTFHADNNTTDMRWSCGRKINGSISWISTALVYEL